jgi:hypothetical protein
VIARYALAALFCSWLCVGCKFDENRETCKVAGDCKASGMSCYEGFCIKSANAPDGRGGSGGGGSGEGEGGSGGAAADGGMDSGPTQPTEAGVACEADATQECVAAWQDAPMLGGCGPGTQQCVNGSWGVCTPERLIIEPETCNDIDDDCDGETDEDSNVPCFPGAAGCVPAEGGGFDCNAPCVAGVQMCVGGSLATCTGYTVPEARDNCATPADENCDGTPNDDCECDNDPPRDCYSGPAGTQGVGICVAGEQECVNRRWGPCVGAVVPRAETCNGEDDDCNRTPDDVARLGDPCTVSGLDGVCAVGTLRCQAGSAAATCVSTQPQPQAETCNMRDDDCNGMVDDDVAPGLLQNDPLNCGACGTRCGSTERCCAGACVTVSSDMQNCGMCGRVCTMSQTCMAGTCTPPTEMDAGTMCDSVRLCTGGLICCDGSCVPSDASNCGVCGRQCTATTQACCGNTCVELMSDLNCGACDNVCTTPDGGPACACATTGTPGTFACRSNGSACP